MTVRTTVETKLKFVFHLQIHVTGKICFAYGSTMLWLRYLYHHVHQLCSNCLITNLQARMHTQYNPIKTNAELMKAQRVLISVEALKLRNEATYNVTYLAR